MKTGKILITAIIAIVIIGAIIVYAYYSGFFGNKVIINANQPLIGGDKDAHGCLIAAGYSWCEASQKCLRLWEESCYPEIEKEFTAIFTQKYNKPESEVNVTIWQKDNNFVRGGILFGDAAEGAGGEFLARLVDDDWVIDYEGNGSIDCAKIRALGYPQTVLEGFCDPIASTLSETQARAIAEKTCIKGGESLAPGVYNENTKTWWFDANLNATKEGCNPACLVDEATQTAEINWRCTGLIEPK